MSMTDSPCDDFYSNQRISNRKRLKTKTYENDSLNNEEQLMLNQVDDKQIIYDDTLMQYRTNL